MVKRFYKKYFVSGILISALVFVTGCSNSKAGNKVTTESAIEQVLQQQVQEETTAEVTTEATTAVITEATTEITTEAIAEALTEETVDDISKENPTETVSETVDGYKQVDLDMTTMDSNMVFYTVSNIMAYPDDYKEKVIRFRGNYGVGFDENTNLRYHYAVIQDAMACCAQGFEFIWGDGSHVWPDEYPRDGQEIIITGIFETYQEEGAPYEYARVRSATLEIVE